MRKILLAYQLNGNIVGIDLLQWNSEDLNGNQPFKIILSGGTIPTGYVNISSIINWDLFGEICANDYMVVRFEIRELCKERGWDNLSDVEKDIAIKHYISDNPTNAVIYLMTVKGMSLGQAQLFVLQSWHKYHAKLLESCKQRIYYMKTAVLQYLSLSDAEKLFDVGRDLIYDFTELGRFGRDIGDKKDGILDYVTSSNEYSGNGMAEGGYVLISGTWNNFIDAVVKILVDGIYNKY